VREKELLIFKDKLYWVYRKVKQNHINEEHINDLRDFWYCDTVLKTKNQEEVLLVFLREITDATIVD
jgi:hypothetical protein